MLLKHPTVGSFRILLFFKNRNAILVHQITDHLSRQTPLLDMDMVSHQGRNGNGEEDERDLNFLVKALSAVEDTVMYTTMVLVSVLLFFTGTLVVIMCLMASSPSWILNLTRTVYLSSTSKKGTVTRS